MSGLLRIHDTVESGYLSFDLFDLLDLIREEGVGLCWRILNLDEVVWKKDYPHLTLGEFYFR